MSIKKYMLIDLGMLSIIAILVEALGTYFVNYMTVGAYPTTVISLLITFLAITRWGYKGLIVIPFCALGNLIGGQFLIWKEANYNWQSFLSVILGLSALSINLIPFKNYGTNVVIKNNWAFGGLMVLDFVLYEFVRSMSYYFIFRGNNLYFVGNSWGYDITGFIILVIMGIVLRMQKVMINFKDKIDLERKQAEEDREYEANFSISEVDESDEEQSSGKKN